MQPLECSREGRQGAEKIPGIASRSGLGVSRGACRGSPPPPTRTFLPQVVWTFPFRLLCLPVLHLTVSCLLGSVRGLRGHQFLGFWGIHSSPRASADRPQWGGAPAPSSSREGSTGGPRIAHTSRPFPAETRAAVLPWARTPGSEEGGDWHQVCLWLPGVSCPRHEGVPPGCPVHRGSPWFQHRLAVPPHCQLDVSEAPSPGAALPPHHSSAPAPLGVPQSLLGQTPISAQQSGVRPSSQPCPF